MAKHLHFLLLFVLSTSLLSASSHFEGFDPEDQYDAVADDQYDVVDHLRPPPLTHTDPPPSTSTAPEPNPPPSDLPNPPSTVGSDYWDEDEFEGLPDQTLEQNSTTTTTTPDPKTKHRSTARIAPVLGPRSSYTVEIVCVSFLIVFVANYFAGKRRNEKLALAWASRFATRGSIFDKNFSLLGLDDDGSGSLLLKEGESVFKFYASGRRFCKGLLATIELKGRHDLMSRVWSVIVGRGDEIRFEVFMNDDAMDNVVFAVARKKAVKAMQKEERDLVRFGAAVSAPGGRKWVAEEVGVVSESKEVAGDLITDVVLDQVFGDKAFEKFGKGFISMHFSDQHIGTHKKMLVFKFALPDAKHMADMTRLVALVPYYIDLIGRYKLSPQARSKTEAARTKAAQEAYKESQNARQEAMQKKKAEKRKIMEEAEAKFSAEAIRKREAKERSRHVKKAAPKVKMTRAH